MTFAYPAFQTVEPVLVCLDLQQHQQAAAAPAERERRRRCVDTSMEVLACARRLRWKVVHIHRAQTRLGPQTPGSKPIAGLEPRPTEPVFVRQGASAFSSGAFQEYLKLLAAPHLIVIGFSLDQSALFTAVSAHEAGVPLSIVKGAVDAPSMGLLGSDVVETVLLGVFGRFTEVLNADELFERTAGALAVHAANLP
jgi:nicotinamidase-related amidase